MPKPSNSTPVEDTIRTTRSIGEWFKKHETHLRKELEASYDVPTVAETLASELQATQEHFVTERKQDKDITTERDKEIVQVREFIKSVQASAERRLATRPDHERMLSDFHLVPSRIRLSEDVDRALTKLNAAITTHLPDLQTGVDRTQEWLAKIATFQKTSEYLSRELGREKRETSDARNKRDVCRARVLAFLDDMELASESIEPEYPEALFDLQALFDAHNPPTPNRKKKTDPTGGNDPDPSKKS